MAMITVGELRQMLEGLPEWWPVEVGLEVVGPDGDTYEIAEAEGVGVAEPVAGIGMVTVAATLGLPGE